MNLYFLVSIYTEKQRKICKSFFFKLLMSEYLRCNKDYKVSWDLEGKFPDKRMKDIG